MAAAACSGAKLSAALWHAAPPPKLAPNGCEEAEGTAWLKTPANRKEKRGFNGGSRPARAGPSGKQGAEAARAASGGHSPSG